MGANYRYYPPHRDAYVNETPFGPMRFKPAGKPHVKGGRWSIRRGRFGPKPWHAYASGRATRFNRRFESHEEAIQHATIVANAFANPTPEKIRDMIVRTMPWINGDSVERNVLRYAVSETTNKKGKK